MGPQAFHPQGDPRGGGGGGFINQHMKLLTLLTLSIHLGVHTVILPSAVSRDTFETSGAQWQPHAPDTLWDVPSIAALLGRHNISLVVGGPGAPALPINSTLVLPTYFCRVLAIETVAEEVRRLVHMHIARLPVRPSNVVAVTLNAPDLILAIRTNNLPLYTEVAAAVRFAAVLTDLADGITRRMLQEAPTFNGLHLRVEGDMRQTHNVSIESELVLYRTYIKGLNYSRSPLFVASGIFTAGGAITTRYVNVGVWLRDSIIGEKLATRIVNRRQLASLPLDAAGPADRAAASSYLRPAPDPLAPVLHSEQQAAVDFLVLLRADKVVGTRLSSFSFMLRELRLLWGRHARSTLGIIGGQWPLFEAAAGLDMSQVPGE